MKYPVIQAASCLGPDGYGNHRAGWRPWSPEVRTALDRHGWEALKWPQLFTTEAPRFSRMDGLSRLGLMAVELLGVEAAGSDRTRIGVCLETRLGSLGTDVRFLETRSPSVFTYTLPSTVIGEICIRHRFKGPVLCLLPGEAAGAGALDVAIDWLRTGEAAACVCLACEAVDKRVAGWVPFAEHAATHGWQAGALFLAPSEGSTGGSAPSAGALMDLARRQCGGPGNR